MLSRTFQVQLIVSTLQVWAQFLHHSHSCKLMNLLCSVIFIFQYLDTKVLEWLRLIYQHSEEKTQNIDSFRGRLMHFIWETYANVLIDQLFSIVIEFPDSEPALADLRLCLEKIDLRSTLVRSLRNSIEVRLLHPGLLRNFLTTQDSSSCIVQRGCFANKSGNCGSWSVFVFVRWNACTAGWQFE